MKRIINIVVPIITFLFELGLFWPFSFLQIVNAAGYSEYKNVELEYNLYLIKYGREPRDINFIPEEIRRSVGDSKYSIKYNEKTGDISYKLHRHYPYGICNFIDYIFHRNMIIGMTIGHVVKSPQSSLEFHSWVGEISQCSAEECGSCCEDREIEYENEPS